MSDKVACNSVLAVLTAVTGLFVVPSTVTCNAEKVAPGAKDIFSLKVRINLLPSLEISEVVNVGRPELETKVDELVTAKFEILIKSFPAKYVNLSVEASGGEGFI